MAPQIHLGINNCFAVKRWPEPDRWIDLITQELGLDSCQFSLDLVDPIIDRETSGLYAETVRELASAANLGLHSTFTGLIAYSRSMLLHPDLSMREAAQQWYEHAIEFTAGLGAKGTGGHLGTFSVADAADDGRRQLLLSELYDRLRLLAGYAASRGLEFLLFEDMAVPREWGHSLEEARELAGLTIEGGVPLLLCLDVGHPCALRIGSPSDDYLVWLAQTWPHSPVLHLQQTDRTGDHHWPFTAEYNRLGMVRAESVLQSIARWPPTEDVFLFLEPIHPFEADDNVVLQDIKQSIQYWRDAIQSYEDQI